MLPLNMLYIMCNTIIAHEEGSLGGPASPAATATRPRISSQDNGWMDTIIITTLLLHFNYCQIIFAD